MVVRGDPTFAPPTYIRPAPEPLPLLMCGRSGALSDVHMNYQGKAEGPPAGGPDYPGTSPAAVASLPQDGPGGPLRPVRPLGSEHHSP